MAQLESDARLARLWLCEREQELDARTAFIERGEKEVVERLERLAAAERALEPKPLAPALDEREQAVSEREARVKSLEKKWRAEIANLEARQRQTEKAARDLAADQTRLHDEQARVNRAHEETQSMRRQLIQDRRNAEEQAKAEKRRMTAEFERRLADLRTNRKALERRSEQVDRSRAALVQLRSELGRMHRETLEIRLATEELWAQLSGTAPPAALTSSLGKVRAKVQEHYRFANSEISQQKEELCAIRKELAEQQRQLVTQKRELETWASRREKTIREAAQRLVAREQELESRQAEFEELRRQPEQLVSC
jgi:hypothetical protein